MGDVHVFIFWHALGERLTRAGIQAVADTPGVTLLEVHVMRWPSSTDSFAACHRKFYANNHAEKGYAVPQRRRYYKPELIESSKGTGPFTVVLFAVDCDSVKDVHVAPCGRQGDECDNAPKAVMLLTLKRMLRKRISTTNKYAIHGTVNGNEAVHDVTSLFGPGYYSRLVSKKHEKRSWNGELTTHPSVECVDALQNGR